MTIIAINGSSRKNWNTGTLLAKAFEFGSRIALKFHPCLLCQPHPVGRGYAPAADPHVEWRLVIRFQSEGSLWMQ